MHLHPFWSKTLVKSKMEIWMQKTAGSGETLQLSGTQQALARTGSLWSVRCKKSPPSNTGGMGSATEGRWVNLGSPRPSPS